MKPEDVRFHHIRYWPWPQKWCPHHGRMVPTFHEHHTKKKKPKGEDHDQEPTVRPE